MPDRPKPIQKSFVPYYGPQSNGAIFCPLNGEEPNHQVPQHLGVIRANSHPFRQLQTMPYHQLISPIVNKAVPGGGQSPNPLADRLYGDQMQDGGSTAVHAIRNGIEVVSPCRSKMMLQDLTSGGHANICSTPQRSDSHESRIGVLQVLKCEDG